MKETSGKIEEISGKIWENNIHEILDKFWIFERISMNFFKFFKCLFELPADGYLQNLLTGVGGKHNGIYYVNAKYITNLA